MRLIELLKTGTFRLAILFALAVMLSTSLVFLFIYWRVAAADLKRLDVRLAAEAARAVTEPEESLRQALELRLTRDLRLIDYAALFDARGKLIYGNIAVLPKNLPVDGSTHSVEGLPIDAVNGQTIPGTFVAARRPDGSVVLLGRSLYEVDALRHVVGQALTVGLVPAIVLALVTGFIFSLRGTRRLIAINQTILRIMHGDLHERLPTRGKMDDINYVASAVNLMLDEIVRLLAQIKSVGDNIAHDLRSPLAVARMKLGFALERGDEKGLRIAAQKALSDIDRALTAVAALLRISELESARKRSNFKAIDLADVCESVFELYEPLAEAKSVVMRCEAQRPLPWVGDFELLSEAIANVVDNAVKFTPAGKDIQITAQMIDGAPVVRIADHGPGVTLEDRGNIFKRFFRSKETCLIPGNGLGLSLAATIAELHGLSLTVEDNHPGAVFEFRGRNQSL